MRKAGDETIFDWVLASGHRVSVVETQGRWGLLLDLGSLDDRFLTRDPPSSRLWRRCCLWRVLAPAPKQARPTHSTEGRSEPASLGHEEIGDCPFDASRSRINCARWRRRCLSAAPAVANAASISASNRGTGLDSPKAVAAAKRFLAMAERETDGSTLPTRTKTSYLPGRTPIHRYYVRL
jgi:hypothetical protein